MLVVLGVLQEALERGLGIQAIKVFANAGFCQVYGSTEGSAIATFLPPADHDPAPRQGVQVEGVQDGRLKRFSDHAGAGAPAAAGKAVPFAP